MRRAHQVALNHPENWTDRPERWTRRHRWGLREPRGVVGNPLFYSWLNTGKVIPSPSGGTVLALGSWRWCRCAHETERKLRNGTRVELPRLVTKWCPCAVGSLFPDSGICILTHVKSVAPVDESRPARSVERPRTSVNG